MLDPLGFRTACYTDGRAALQALKTLRPAAIILDLLMPNLDGVQFLARLREAPESAGIPVFIWTMKDLSAQELAELRKSADAVLSKSVDSGGLAMALRHAIGLRAGATGHE
jgi:CheY-like chemotaxis protein